MSHYAIDNYNYANDSRVRASRMSSSHKLINDILECCSDEDLESYGVDRSYEPPMYWEVCSLCEGEGKVVNPSIDAGGLTHEDFAEDPDFYHDYMNGVYDITCPECKGRTTVRAINWDCVPEGLANAVQEWHEDEAASYAEHLAEIRMGC